MNLTCNICNSEMKLYHKNLYRLIYYCYNCCNFKCKIYNNNNENIINNNDDKNIFSLYKKYKLNISLFVFYSMFYNQNSYFISDSLDIEWELEKTINYIHKHQTNVNIIYIHCFSYDNIFNIKNQGVYNVHSTNSAKYFGSKFNLTLANIFVIPEYNKTIYEFRLYSYYQPKYISDLLLKEIEYGLYLV